MTTSRSSARAGRARCAVVLAAALAATVFIPHASAGSFGGGAYGWPLKPFDRQHPVRGFFGDPRIGETPHGESHTFHFGVDISAPDGTAVYATATGRVVWESVRPETISIVTPSGAVFSYWHVVPAVRNGESAVAYRTIVGRIADGWEHVHFSEFVDGRYLNPLRPGALGPYRDTTAPAVHLVSLERDGRPVGRGPARGAVDLVAEVRDETPLRVPGRWSGRPVMPSLVRWRVVRPGGGAVTAWATAFDVRLTLPTCRFEDRYATWTRQNRPWSNGRYRVLLARRFDVGRLAPGRYAVEIAVSDTRGNASGSRRFFTAGGSN